MDNKASMTALMSAFARAYHSESHKNPIFNDFIARKLISDDEYEQMKSYIKGGIDFFAPDKKGSFLSDDDMLKWIVDNQLAPTPVVRARFCEESLEAAIKTGTRQYVILGAGLDTFAWRRSDLMKEITVFEVDHPLTQEDKKKRLKGAGLEIPDNLRFVHLDFAVDNLKDKLADSGFDFSRKTFFSWLGVSYYLSREQIENMLENISSFAAEGSTLLFDIADEELFTSNKKRVQNMLAMAAASGEPMKFCCNEMNLMKLLEEHHFLIYEFLTPEDINFRYFMGSNGLSAFEHISYVTAVIKGTQFIDMKEKILLTALNLFSQKGYKAVSVRDISSHIGITQAALYKHYKNKQDIFTCIIKRMEENDPMHSKEWGMPKEPEYNLSAYENIQLEHLKSFTKSMFHYWTENTFAASFRKMLTVEQYHGSKMMSLYEQYLSDGPLQYIESIFREIGEKAGKLEADFRPKALRFYAPVYMLMNLYDYSEDKQGVVQLLNKHIDTFIEDLA